MEGRMSLGENVDLDLYGQLAGHLRRIFETLGIERRAKDMTPPNLSDYLSARAQQMVRRR
jgi:hypothetical protein